MQGHLDSSRAVCYCAASFDKGLQENDYGNGDLVCCTHHCTQIEVDEHALLDSSSEWPSLAEQQRARKSRSRGLGYPLQFARGQAECPRVGGPGH